MEGLNDDLNDKMAINIEGVNDDMDFETDFNKWREETEAKNRQLAENKHSEREMMNTMTKLVFNQDHLQDLKSGIGEVLDVFMEILETPTKSIKDVKNRLQKIHSNRWKKIQERYNLHEDDEVDSVARKLPQSEQGGVTCVVLNFISHMDRCTQSVINKLEEKHKDIIVMEGKVKQMEERLCQAEDMFLHQKSMYVEVSSKNAGLLASKTHLDSLVKEKNRRIEELEKESNVQCWEHEKNRIFKETSERIKHLEEELKEIKEGRDQYKKRMSTIDSSYQKMKMRQQLLKERAGRAHSSDEYDSDREASDQLSRNNFLQDKEIAYLERELYALQSSTVGVIGGMKIDINKLGPKLIDEDGRVDKEFEQLSSRVRKVYTAVLDGDMGKAKEELPAHYKYHEDDTFRVRKMRRLSQSTLPTTRVIHTMLDENKKTDLQKTEITEEYTNPVIVNPTTRKLHPINPLKYFGHMSQQFLLDQFDKFVEYDKNGDGSLDLTEVVKVVSCLGFTFNAHQLQEAMEEVDRDHNHTLDFYEYLLIIDNIYKRNGKASLFQEGLSEIKKKNMSKSCVIQ